jgi:hypothetical protein
VVDQRGHWTRKLSDVAVNEALIEAAKLTERGLTVLSPIAIAVPLIHAAQDQGWPVRLPDPLDHRAWLRWCGPLLEVSSCVVVPDIPCAVQSKGVFSEVVEAVIRNRRVFIYGSGSDLEPRVGST